MQSVFAIKDELKYKPRQILSAEQAIYSAEQVEFPIELMGVWSIWNTNGVWSVISHKAGHKQNQKSLR